MLSLYNGIALISTFVIPRSLASQGTEAAYSTNLYIYDQKNLDIYRHRSTYVLVSAVIFLFLNVKSTVPCGLIVHYGFCPFCSVLMLVVVRMYCNVSRSQFYNRLYISY